MNSHPPWILHFNIPIPYRCSSINLFLHTRHVRSVQDTSSILCLWLNYNILICQNNIIAKHNWTLLNCYVYAWPFIHYLYFIYARKFYVRSHGKITRQRKSTLKDTFYAPQGCLLTRASSVGRGTCHWESSFGWWLELLLTVDAY